MRAVFYETHGDAQVLKAAELGRLVCGPEQILIEVAATGGNSIEQRLRVGQLTEYIQRAFPVVPVPLTETLPPESAVEGHLLSESRRARGKPVLSINDL